jgi:hypothetical protein
MSNETLGPAFWATRFSGMSSRIRRVASQFVAIATATLITASCTTTERQPAPSAATVLDIRTAQRADFHVTVSDTLSDSAHVLGTAVESDGGTVAFVFADPAKKITAGLGLSRTGEDAAQLVWPDSVTSVWWSRPHALAFTTSRGARVVVDVHAEKLETMADSSPTAAPGVATKPSDRSIARAVNYVDSLHFQPGGKPQRSALRYQVESAMPASKQPLMAFYVLASDSSGRKMNPAWFAMDTTSGAVTKIDEVVGAPTELPQNTAGWTDDGHFIYTKGFTLWSAEVVRRAR